MTASTLNAQLGARSESSGSIALVELLREPHGCPPRRPGARAAGFLPHRCKRSLLAGLAVLASVMAGGGSARAQSFSYTDDCESRLSSSDEVLVEEAYLAAYRYQDRMWNEIEVDSARPAQPNPCGPADAADALCASFQQQRCYYSAVPDNHRDKWTEAMDHVEVNCDSNKCATSSSLYGFCGLAAWDLYPSDKILVCVSNIRAVASSLNNSLSSDAVAAGTFAKLAGTIAHEIMHQADGWQGHPTGSTDYTSPNTSAESVGVAMEHVLLSPDLSTSIQSIAVAWNGSAYSVTVDGTIYNLNEYSGPAGTTPFSQRVRNNTYARMALYLDGAQFDYLYQAPIAGGATSSFSYSFDVAAASGDGLHQLTVVTDDLDNIWELDEDNNEATRTFSIATDLAVDVEIAGPYSTGVKALVKNGVPSTATYRRLTYNVTVTNRADAFASPPTELLIQYDNMWNSGSLSSVLESVSALEPGAATTYSFSVDVPVTFGNVTGVTDVYVTVDADQALPDSDRNNNSVHLAIDNAYFKPDYRISLEALTIDGTTATAAYTVKNIGPEPGTAYSWVGFYVNGALGTSLFTNKLAVATSASASLTSFFPGIENLSSHDLSFTFLVKADCTGSIVENNEDNNTESLTVTVPGVTFLRDLERADGWISTTINESDWQRFIPESADMIFDQMFDGYTDAASWYFANAGNGPFIPDVIYDMREQIVITRNTYSIRPPVLTILR